MSINIDKLIFVSLFYWTTWIYIFVNILIAWMPNISIYLMLIRDFWIAVFILFLLLRSRYIALSLIIFYTLLSSILLLNNYANPQDIYVYMYGLRSMLFIFFVSELLQCRNTGYISEGHLKLFFSFIIIAALSQFIFSNILDVAAFNAVFNIDDYFQNKGIESNLKGGLSGDRVSLPLYSAALISTLVGSFIYILPFIWSRYLFYMGVVISIVTMSKVFLVGVFFYLVKSWWKISIILGVLLLPVLSIVIEELLNTVDLGVLSYHLKSAAIHLNSFDIAFERITDGSYPDIIGFNSTASSSFSDLEQSGIESLFFFIIADLGMFALPLLAYLIYVYNHLNGNLKKKYFSFFIIISFLSNLSNQPVAFIGAILMINILKNKGYSK